ncbi:MAG: hypothetical protein H0W88_10675 [Parachlamydiaceae bacterium]|nr:hypothetical protein [Parachlamydiaceae bacterium]
MPFVKAKAGPSIAGDSDKKFTVQYFDEQRNMTIRSGGTRAWRCNNPGALLKSSYSISKDRRAIGTAGFGAYEYAVYPDYPTGHEALVVMLRGSRYRNLTLLEASLRYVGEDPGHGPKISKMSNLDPNRKINTLSNEEFERYWKAIEKNERWDIGQEDFIEKWIISGVHKKRGVIFEYLVQKPKEDIWMKKEAATSLANEGRLHAIIVHLKNGGTYLRPEYGTKPFEVIT